jgi:hypothetical protein
VLALVVAVLLAGCTDAETASVVGKWTPDDSQQIALAGDRGDQMRAHLSRIGERSLEFDSDGTVIHVDGPITRRSKWRVSQKKPLTIETRTELGDAELVDTYTVVFPGPDALSLVESGGHRSRYTRAR